jgi:4-amino-4-deoxychorismate lyase
MHRTHTYLINGDFNQAISPLDRGFAYGDGVFRTMVMRSGLPVDWPLHYQKLVADCAAIGIVCPSAELLMSDFQQLFTLDEIEENRLGVAKIIITRGEGERGYKPPAVTTPTRVVIKSAMPQYTNAFYTTGVHLHVCDTRLASQTKLAGIKHLNRLENVMARMEWRDDSMFDGLLLDHQGNVIECTMSNIFARFDTVLVTPDLSQCGVAGVTRQRIFELAAVLNLTVEVMQLSLSRLLQADEVIICNSLYGVFQVNKIGDATWSQQALAKTFRNLLTHD